ncbi:MAG: carbon-nitrogen hydrolase family protein [Opitutaceae bacterium]
MKIALAQISVVRGDIEQNLAKLKRLIVEAASVGAQSVFFPEMCTTGFDGNYNQSVLDDAQRVIQELQTCAKASAIAVSGSFLEKTESGRAANTLYYIECDGSIVAKYRKAHLFTLFKEQAHVEAGDSIVVADTELGKLGCSICYDLRFPELFRSCMQQGATIQFLPAAFPHPRLVHWQTLIRARAIENQSFFIAVNQCGSEAHGSTVGDVSYFGHSSVVDPWGEILYEADETEGLHFVDIDLGSVDIARTKLPALKDRRPDL